MVVRRPEIVHRKLGEKMQGRKPAVVSFLPKGVLSSTAEKIDLGQLLEEFFTPSSEPRIILGP